MRTIFTTGQISKICEVCPRVVCKWFDSGRLQGSRVPGSRHRRIPRENFIRFLKEYGMPLGELEDEEVCKLLLIGVTLSARKQFQDLLVGEDWKIESAASGFDAGIQAEALHPDCAIIDFSMGQNQAALIAQHLRNHRHHSDIILIGLLDKHTAHVCDREVFSETFMKPFESALLAIRIRTLVEKKKQLA